MHSILFATFMVEPFERPQWTIHAMNKFHYTPNPAKRPHNGELYVMAFIDINQPLNQLLGTGIKPLLLLNWTKNARGEILFEDIFNGILISYDNIQI
ncbi:unnamed protein product, partial [Vitis vinifera]|uniref:Uncharacterized protein n=1 Tax=Vitis vinifera TaxID=29760 RepID=D7TSK6_VITVI